MDVQGVLENRRWEIVKGEKNVQKKRNNFEKGSKDHGEATAGGLTGPLPSLWLRLQGIFMET